MPVICFWGGITAAQHQAHSLATATAVMPQPAQSHPTRTRLPIRCEDSCSAEMAPERFFLELDPPGDISADVPHVVIVGGGFAGLKAAQALRGRPVRVTLID
jgi:NADPH-dependent 2,4-dienoyl-CoA reductase/sulfur reductase-like enzyme